MDHALQLRKFAERCMASDMERAGLKAAATEIARLRAALEAIIVSDDPITIALKALAAEGK